MQDGDLRVSTTTDSAAVASAVANAEGEGGRVPAPKLDVENLDGSTAVSFEHPRSERTLLLERLAGHESDLEALTGHESEQVASTESETDQTGDGEPVDESKLGIDMEAVRQAATQDAIEDARRLHRQAYYQEQAQQHLSPQAELNRVRAELAAPFVARMNQIVKPADKEKLFRDAAKEGTDVSEPVRDALLALPGGAEATVFLLQHPEERQRLARLPEHVQVASVGQLTARLDPAAKRQRSNAPAPITPVGGSATKSSVPLEEMSYQDYRRVRDQQAKNRYRK